MIHDAFSAGVEPGGLYSSQEIKILICYMLAGAGEPMPREAVLEILSGGGMANFFEAGAALEELMRLGHLNEADGLLTLTEDGRQAAGTLSGMIPYTLRERSVRAALHLLTRRRREKENRVTVAKGERGRTVTCSIGDGEEPLMSISLQVADELQARHVREQFLEDPTLIYRALVALLAGDADWTRQGSQIRIDLE